MPPNRSFRRALSSLAHPLSFSAIGILLLNALVLQPHFASWWTGKLGDFAWLLFAPFLLAAFLAWMIPETWPRKESIVGIAAMGTTGLVFAAVKAVPSVNSLVAGAFLGITGVPAKLALDPTDCVALASLIPAWWLWTHAPERAPSPRPLLALALALFAIVADAPAPQATGIKCLDQQRTTLVAYRQFVSQREYLGSETRSWQSLTSDDGGWTWTAKDRPSSDPCSALLKKTIWETVDPKNRNVHYRFTRAKSVELSQDGGKTFQEIAGAFDDAIMDSSTGNLIVVSEGGFKVSLHTPEGNWQDVPIAPY